MQLAGNTAERNSGTRTHQPSLLARVLFDAHGNRMTPSYAVKKGARYRYYVSTSLITAQRDLGTAAGESRPAILKASSSIGFALSWPIPQQSSTRSMKDRAAASTAPV